jgi:hypothetical protein
MSRRVVFMNRGVRGKPTHFRSPFRVFRVFRGAPWLRLVRAIQVGSSDPTIWTFVPALACLLATFPRADAQPLSNEALAQIG